MNNKKLVTISIFTFFKKYDKNVILYFFENIHEKILEFGCMHENKTFFLCFFKFLIFLKKVSFNCIFYGLNI
jgi:hypothetical protein